MSGNAMKFIMLVEAFFPRPKFNGDDAREALWLRTMQDMLNGWDGKILVEAANKIIRERNPAKHGTMFPKPHECLEVIRDLAEDGQRHQLRLEGPRADDWSNDRLELAFDLVNGELGKRAAREGWISQLYNFCRKEMRLPKSSEIAVCIEQFELLEQAIAAFNAGPRAGLNGAICAMADTVLTKRAELRERVLHGVI